MYYILCIVFRSSGFRALWSNISEKERERGRQFQAYQKALLTHSLVWGPMSVLLKASGPC